jgi:uncharacterized FAD-dependent dehydrogenase
LQFKPVYCRNGARAKTKFFVKPAYLGQDVSKMTHKAFGSQIQKAELKIEQFLTKKRPEFSTTLEQPLITQKEAYSSFDPFIRMQQPEKVVKARKTHLKSDDISKVVYRRGRSLNTQVLSSINVSNGEEEGSCFIDS